MDTTELIKTARDMLAREQAQQALDLIGPVVPREPRNIELLRVLAETLMELDRPADATAVYQGILGIDPQHAEATTKVKEAIAAMEMLLKLASNADDLRAWDEARENYEAVLHQYPLAILALTRLLAMDGFEGRLGDADRHERFLIRALKAIDLLTIHHNNLAMIAYQAIMRPLTPSVEKDVTTALNTLIAGLAAKIGPLPSAQPKSTGRLRIGYLSNNFRDHPIGHVTCALFAAHDRSKVETHVFYYPAGEANPYTDQIKAGAEHFHIEHEPAAVARAIARENLDVLVYLDGYMSTFLLPVVARRPAPIQVYWLGHAGSCEIDGIDYFIADDTVVPPGEEALYRAKTVRLPGTYHPASPHPIGRDMSREDAGLPERGFVFCAFNNPEKIDTPTFDLWMRILRRVPDSLLWLSVTQSKNIVENLRKEAESRGVKGERLVFATRVPDKAAHLARHRHAGLFLDTLGLNASTTALDALWAGLPLLTVTGPRFASRIATSFLKALDLPDLICRTAQEFEERAVILATNPAALGAARGRLAANLTSQPLFQTEAFCRKLEAALIDIAAAHPR
jgi:predicted O-linked N-acetylglucosamine transferase (SPINDLY family)